MLMSADHTHSAASARGKGGIVQFSKAGHQDYLKVHPRLTLNDGVSWEPYIPWVDKYDRLTSL